MNSIERQKKNAWMVTFNDLLSLLLIFFILLYTVSEASNAKWREASESLFNRFSAKDNFEAPFIKSVDTDYLYKTLSVKISEHSELTEIVVTNLKDKLIISIPMRLMFKENSIDLNLKSQSVIYFISSLLFDLNNIVSVNAIGNSSALYAHYGSDAMALNLKRANLLAEMLEENAFLENVRIFIMNKEYYQISSENNERKYSKYVDRIDIIINDEKVENNFNYNVK